MDPIEITDKIGVRLEEYQGRWTLVSCWKGREGDWKDNWCKIEVGKEKEVKNRKLGAYLGDRETALKALSALYHGLKGNTVHPPKAKPELPDIGDSPF
jgi:hypothetical protein